MREPEWLSCCAVFAKGFNNEHINSHLAGMIEEVKTDAETLRDFAKKREMFYLNPVTLCNW
jgi:hypothetical protein